VGKKPTWFVTEIANLVPACGKCNQSKGAKDWKIWMLSKAKRSPTTRGKSDVGERVARSDAFERWRAPIQVDYETAVGRERWAVYLKKLDDFAALLRMAQAEALELRDLVNTIGQKPLPTISPAPDRISQLSTADGDT